MATNFPTSVDALTNPVSNDSLNSPSHSAQHANANDAIEAIETFLLPGGAGNSGLVKIIPTGATNGTVAANGDVTIGSAVSSVTVSGAFSAAYDNYKIIISGGVGSTVANISLQLGAVTTNYQGVLNYANYVGSVVTPAGSGSSNFQFAGSVDTNANPFSAELINPFLSTQTYIESIYIATNNAGKFIGRQNSTTSFTAFTLAPSSGTLTGGNIRIYGYK